MNSTEAIDASCLEIDPVSTAHEIEAAIHDIVFTQLRRKGVVVGISGGVDSSVVAALCVRSLGSERVVGIMMPERESANDSLGLANQLADELKICSVLEDITTVLEAAGCYRRRDDAIRKLVPEFGPSHKCKLVVPAIASGAQYVVPSLVIESPDGRVQKLRLSAEVYLEIVAATNFKQRVRKMFEYHHADRLQYAVAGTPNRLEYEQGFFVKNGDGAADLKPIAHLYKSQVYQLAEYLQLPREIRERPSTTDTFSMPQSQEEFYFSLPLRTLDLCLFGKNQELSCEDIARMSGLSIAQVQTVLDSIESKRRATAYLHQPPLLVQSIPATQRN
ncbi:MAG TPA: NAD(+) synthase [Terriglobales bacterium]|nr:NAD(+) synthase [Terriglobales bacterium]